MYIQITERCNMHCLHCCMNATSTGRDMTEKVFNAAIRMCNDRCDVICLGGGEPTLHKKFWKFLLTAIIENESEMPVWLATNGSVTKTAIKLAKLARNGVISCALSQDIYHDEIDDSVINAFSIRGYNNGDDRREIRDVSGYGITLSHTGRAVEMKAKGLIDQKVENKCCCNELFITPDGKIWHCGCKQLQYGTVFKPKLPHNINDLIGSCSRFDNLETYSNYQI